MAQDVFYPRSVFTVKRCTVVKVMSALREKTRRLWTSALFVILGPTALCLACGFLYWQRIPRSAEAVGTGISQRLRYEVSLERRERIRPNVQRFINVKIKSRESNENVLFIPEVYKVVLSDLKLLHSFAASFDNRGLSADADAHDDDQSVSNKNARSQNEISKSFSNIIYDSADQLNSYVLIVLPRVLFRQSQESEKRQAFTDHLLRALGNETQGMEQPSVLCVVADEIQILAENDFETASAELVGNPTLRSKQELVGSFRTAVFQTPRGSTGITEIKTRNEALAFASEPPKLEKFRALRVNSENYVRTDVLFELQKISAPTPYYASILMDKINNCSQIEYDSGHSPTPGTLASQFFPFLSFLGSQGWFTGKTVFRTDSGTINLDNVHLCGYRLENLCERFSLPTFTGEVSDLTISGGQICNGVFRGEGSIRVYEGSIPFKVIERLHSIKMLNVSPQQAMQLRFINDATPFNELELQFSFDENGVLFDSNYRNKIVAYYEKDAVKYGFFLPKETAGKRAPYAAPLTALFDSQDERSFWNPLVRNALNHLPIPETADVRTDIQALR